MTLHYASDRASDIRCDDSLLNRQIDSPKDSWREQDIAYPIWSRGAQPGLPTQWRFPGGNPLKVRYRPLPSCGALSIRHYEFPDT